MSERRGTYASSPSNSSRFLWRDRNAAARFLTNRASRLDNPETSGGMKSFVEMGPLGGARDFLPDMVSEDMLETEEARVKRAVVLEGEME